MICVSKADEGSFKHLTWNQSPGELAPRQTTREDLNGISNLREHVGACQDTGGGASGAVFTAVNERRVLEIEPPVVAKQSVNARVWSLGTLFTMCTTPSTLSWLILYLVYRRTSLAPQDGNRW